MHLFRTVNRKPDASAIPNSRPRGGVSTGLPAGQFAPLFDLSDEELAARGAVRRFADARVPGYPCRISLTDAREGDELLLVNYEHHPVASPYRMHFAVYVRCSETTYDAVDEVPEQLSERMLAVRAFDESAMMVGWARWRRRSNGSSPTQRPPTSTSTSRHPGCYAARVERA